MLNFEVRRRVILGLLGLRTAAVERASGWDALVRELRETVNFAEAQISQIEYANRHGGLAEPAGKEAGK